MSALGNPSDLSALYLASTTATGRAVGVVPDQVGAAARRRRRRPATAGRVLRRGVPPAPRISSPERGAHEVLEHRGHVDQEPGDRHDAGAHVPAVAAQDELGQPQGRHVPGVQPARPPARKRRAAVPAARPRPAVAGPRQPVPRRVSPIPATASMPVHGSAQDPVLGDVDGVVVVADLDRQRQRRTDGAAGRPPGSGPRMVGSASSTLT